MYLQLAVSEHDFECSGTINGPVCEVSVPMHFLNDTNVFYIFHVGNAWKTKSKWRSPFCTAKRTSISRVQSNILGVLWAVG